MKKYFLPKRFVPRWFVALFCREVCAMPAFTPEFLSIVVKNTKLDEVLTFIPLPKETHNPVRFGCE